MITPPTAPSPGKPVSASFFSRLISWVKSGQLIEGVGYRLRRTPNGTALDLDLAKMTGVPAAADIWRFAMIALKADEQQEEGEEEEQEEGGEEEQEQTFSATFANPYYDIGGRTYKMPEDDSVDPPAVHLEGIKDGDIVVIKISATDGKQAELVSVEGMKGLNELQKDLDYYSLPLYLIEEGKVVCDFRTGPSCSMGEFEE